MKKLKPKMLILILTILLFVSMLMGVGMGALKITPLQTIGILGKSIGLDFDIPFNQQQQAVLIAIRLPRVLLGLLVGSALAIAGASMQGLFRNPLADPGLIGISSGASLSAVFSIVIGLRLFSGVSGILGFYSLSVITFIGAFLTTILVYRLSQVGGKTIVSTMLLAGIAINALMGAITGLIIYSANDAQLRSITFWTLGSLGGATWSSILGVLPFILIPLFTLPKMSKSLNAFALGESNASHLGVNTERIKRIIILLTALCVGASVAVSGMIGFVGLVVPHIIRMLIGPDHRYLLVSSALLGATLLTSADVLSRTAFAPAELPIGIITAIIGAPFFLYILLKERKQQKLI